MRKVILSILISIAALVATFPKANAQKTGKEKIDSLVNNLNSYKLDDTIKVNLLRDISFTYYVIDPQRGIEYGEKGVALAEKLGFQKGVMNCLISTGVCNWASSNYPKALELLFKALRIAEAMGDKGAISRATGNIGNIYADQKNYNRALEYYHKALKISEEMNDTKGIARKLGNIGTIYKEMNPPEYLKALEYFTKSLKLYEKAGELRGILIMRENISWVYTEQTRYKDAIATLLEASKFIHNIGEERWVMYYYGTIGEAYFKMVTNPSPSYKKQLNMFTPAEREHSLKLSIENLLKAVSMAKHISAEKQMIDWYYNISSAYSSLGNWKNAFLYADSSHKQFLEVFNSENKLKVEELDARREAEIKQKELELQKERLDNANIQRIAAGIGVLLLAIIVLLIYNSRRKSEKLLLNILPASIAQRLKKREKHIAEMYDNAAVVFIDIVGFTQFSKDKDPRFLIELLTDLFAKMDRLADLHKMEKIKTIGDSYMAVCGLPDPSPDSVDNAARFAIECRDMMSEYYAKDGSRIYIRIGMDAGQVIAGVIGGKKYSYDLWGDIVNTASRMESLGVAGQIQVTSRVVDKLSDRFSFKKRGEIDVKGQGVMTTWILEG